MICFFFFKQKTAYEMRISDLSSDVCSSDLKGARRGRAAAGRKQVGDHRDRRGEQDGLCDRDTDPQGRDRLEIGRKGGRDGCGCPAQYADQDQPRSEEHTSELQSLMRISYAVFCLKKKKQIKNKKQTTYTKRHNSTYIQAYTILKHQ